MVSRVCETVVMRARRGRRIAGGRVERDSKSAVRVVRARSDILEWVVMASVVDDGREVFDAEHGAEMPRRATGNF
jgi:hypothetical protein